jgi:hypothetical protein
MLASITQSYTGPEIYAALYSHIPTLNQVWRRLFIPVSDWLVFWNETKFLIPYDQSPNNRYTKALYICLFLHPLLVPTPPPPPLKVIISVTCCDIQALNECLIYMVRSKHRLLMPKRNSVRHHYCHSSFTFVWHHGQSGTTNHWWWVHWCPASQPSQVGGELQIT